MNIYCVMELLTKGPLDSLLEEIEETYLPEEIVKNIASQVLQSCAFIH